MRRAPVVLASVAVAVFAGFTIRTLHGQLQDTLVHPWTASQYWLDYRDGLVRRGLPGAGLRLLCGGRPSGAIVATTGVVLTLAAMATLLAISVRVARAAVEQRLLLLGLLVVSPLTFGLLLRDIGRYDTVVIVCLGFFALAPRPAQWRSPVVAGVAAAAVLVVAGGTEEFSIGFLLPVAYLWAGWRGERLAPVVAPGVAVSMLSIVSRPSAALVAEVIADARAEGARVTNTPNYNAVVVLRNSLREQVSFVFEHSRTQQLQSFFVFALAYAGVVSLLHRMVAPDRRLVALAGWQAAVASTLCVIGVDYRRWWALALVGLLAGVVHLVPAASDGAPRVPVAPLVLAAWMLVFAVLSEVPIESNWLPDTVRNYFT